MAINTRPPPRTDDSIVSPVRVSLHTAVSCEVRKKQEAMNSRFSAFYHHPNSCPPQTLLFISICCDLRLTNCRCRGKDEYSAFNVCTEQCTSSLKSEYKHGFSLPRTVLPYTMAMSSLMPFLTTCCPSPMPTLTTIISSTS